MRSRLLILLVLVAVGIAAWALAPPVDPPTAHDRAMARFARSLRRVPLDGVVVDQGVAFGLDAPAPGRRRYLLQTTEQAIDDWDLGDFRCH